MVANTDVIVGNDTGAIEQRKRADFDGGPGAEVEHDAEVNGTGFADLERIRTGAAKELKTVSSLDVSGIVHLHIFRDFAGMPIVRQCAVRVHDAGCAGFPIMRAPAGTSRVMRAPGSIIAPAPIRTPFRIVALGPTQTSSSITTALRAISGRERPCPRGEQAMASATRWAGSSG